MGGLGANPLLIYDGSSVAFMSGVYMGRGCSNTSHDEDLRGRVASIPVLLRRMQVGCLLILLEVGASAADE